PMTPAYASPEQRRGDAVTTVSDVYALGLMLWRLAAGERRPEWRPGGPPPQPPSRVVGGLAARAAPQLAKDLDAVVLRCLEEQPDDRYLGAEALSSDLQNLLAARPVTTRRLSGFDLFRRWVVHNRLAAASIGAASLFLIAGIVISATFAVRAHHERQTALDEANKSRAAMVFVEGLLDTSQASPEVGETVTVRELLGEARERLDADLGDQPALQRELMALMTRVYRSFSLHDDAVAMAEREYALILREDPDVVEHALARQRLGYEQVLAGDDERAIANLEAATEVLRRELGSSALAGLVRGERGFDPRLLTAMRLQSYAASSRPPGGTLELRRLVLEGERYNAAGADDFRVAQALNDYARTLYFAGRLDEAAGDLVEADAMRRRLGAGALDLSVSLGNLSMVRLAQDRASDAEYAARDSLRYAVEAEGRSHPSTATPLLHLGHALRAQGRHDEALEVALEAVAIRRQYLPDHPRLGDAYSLLGALRCDAGDYAAAEELFLQDRAFKVASYSETNWRVGRVDGEYGRCLGLTGDVEAARMRLESGLELILRKVSMESPLAARIQGYLDAL
ncbi:MAG: tetratricopeptide repeat-containing protein kinase family protein, partial [Acidobacteriota bacterium]